MTLANELILYATPVGAFADRCASYWAALAAAGRATIAQRYPPHCTLTGFFHRRSERIPDVIEALEAACARSSPLAGPVSTRPLAAAGDWVGFEIESAWFDQVCSSFVAGHQVHSGEDALRPKSRLHLSVAYGAGANPRWHLEQARTYFAGIGPSVWSIGLWRRKGKTWDELWRDDMHG